MKLRSMFIYDWILRLNYNSLANQVLQVKKEYLVHRTSAKSYFQCAFSQISILLQVFL